MAPAPRSDAAAIAVRPVRTRAERNAFVTLPERIFAGDPAWIAPLRRDERCKLSPKCHPFYRHGTAEFWIAWRGGEAVGRISAQINRLAQRSRVPPVVHFGMLDAIDARDAFAALVGAAAEWARARGAQALEGPYSLSLNEEFGVLVDGFEAPPVAMMAHTKPYYLARLAELGFAKAKDFHHLVVMPEAATLAKVRTFLERLRMPENSSMRHASARTLRRDFHFGMRVYNAAWQQQWGFLPVTEAEVEFLADRLRFIFDPKLLLLAEREGEVIGLCCCIPDYNEITRDLGGRLLPLGWLRFARRLAMHRIKGARLILIGIDPRYHKTPGGAALHVIMVCRMTEYLLRRGYRALELAWIVEDNRDMLKLAAHFDAKHRKTYRVLTLPLDQS